jgi:outer membrane protein TolC
MPVGQASWTVRGFFSSRIVLAFCLLPAFAQTPLTVEKPDAPLIIRPYAAPEAPPIRLSNSPRLSRLLRAGKLYLTVQDAIALAIENNLDLEVDRYGPLVQQWQLERFKGGGTLRGVTAGNSQVGQVASGQGVVGSERSAGLALSQNNGSGGSLGATVTQLGPVTPNLDPVLQNTSLWSHQTYPQANTVVSQTNTLIDNSRIYNTSVQEGVLTGGYVQATFNESYLNENAPSDVLNPSVAPQLRLYIQHNLLQGFGVGVNSRFIRVAKKNLIASQSTFESQLLNIVARVLNLYWDLVTAQEQLQATQSALRTAETFYGDTKTEIHAGALSRVDIYASEREVATRKRELTLTQTSVRQQENQLKSFLLRSDDPLVDEAEIVPLDKIEIPKEEELPPLRDLVKSAAAKRPDFAVTQINQETSAMTAEGTTNSLLPTLIGFAGVYDSGLAGTPNAASGLVADPQFVGGLGKAFGQVFRRDFPNQRAGAYLQIPFNNRQAQGDYGIDQLQLKQNELSAHRDLNQLVVDISSQMVALRQARVRYATAADTRALQQQLLEKVKLDFSLGGATLNDLITAQRSLSAAQTTEVSAQAAYSHARIALDQVLGETLEKNHVSVSEALAGRATSAQ